MGGRGGGGGVVTARDDSFRVWFSFFLGFVGFPRSRLCLSVGGRRIGKI